jgi:hypothetical protein
VVDRIDYVPVLPVKRGEQAAIAAFEPSELSGVRPIFVVTAPEADEDGMLPSIEEYLRRRARQVSLAWRRGTATADLGAFDDRTLVTGAHPIEHFHAEVRNHGTPLIPVVQLTATVAQQDAVRATAALDGLGLCVRVPARDWRLLGEAGRVDHLLASLRTSPRDADLVLDVGDLAGSRRAYGNVVQTLSRLRRVEQWRSLALVGTSYPSYRERLSSGINERPRRDWSLHEHLWHTPSLTRRPTYGDYGANHPDSFPPSPYRHDIHGTLRYSTPEIWIIVRGELYSGRAGAVGGRAMPAVADRLWHHRLVERAHHCAMESWVVESRSAQNAPEARPPGWSTRPATISSSSPSNSRSCADKRSAADPAGTGFTAAAAFGWRARVRVSGRGVRGSRRTSVRPGRA